ncbi:hypothetical protein KSP40_PGU022099 [Platanthera guangdongensis]|uniref:Secreted protein n=1 Tax=Platanthera guangdongensis TaxID=2320717 RepID=A0ABR2LH28_9ASPA
MVVPLFPDLCLIVLQTRFLFQISFLGGFASSAVAGCFAELNWISLSTARTIGNPPKAIRQCCLSGHGGLYGLVEIDLTKHDSSRLIAVVISSQSRFFDPHEDLLLPLAVALQWRLHDPQVNQSAHLCRPP